jgi:hypothetical protein
MAINGMNEKDRTRWKRRRGMKEMKERKNRGEGEEEIAERGERERSRD